MSLQLAAQHLSHQGRGGDSTLVHMSPREVKSLSDLAMAHGGQLSINPQTGLPEAGFLSSILPMVAGFALGPAGFGLSAGAAGLAAGALGFAMTGSLEKGLMAGLGAYGGANLGGSLTEVGIDAAVAADPKVLAAKQAASELRYNPTGEVLSPAQNDAYVKAAQQVSADASAASTAARTGAQTAYDKLGFMEKMGQSFDTLKAPGGASGLFDKISSSPMSLLKTVGSAASPVIDEANKPKPIEETKGDADMGQRYGFSMNPTGGQQVQPGQDPLANTQSSTTTPFPTPDIYGREQRYFAPSYSKLTPEQAKSMYGYAEGGTAQANPQLVEQPFPMPQYTNAGKQPPATSPADPPALLAFKQMQAQRAAQPQTPQYAPTPATGGYLNDPTPAPTTVEGLYTKYLNRASDKGGLDFWNKRFGPTVEADEATLFRASAEPELAARRGESIPTTVEGLYRTYLDRAPDPGGLDFWNKHFGPDVDASELARFKHATIPELTENKRLFESTGGTLAREFNNYLGQTVGVPNQPQAPAESPPATGDGFLRDFAGMKNNPFDYSNLSESERNRPGLFGPGGAGQDSSSELLYDPIKQRYSKNPNFAAPAAESDEPAADAFDINKRPVVGYTAKGEKIYGEKKMGGYGVGGGGHAAGGSISHLGDYSDGGRLLRGPGDGVSDSIPAMIGKKQPARLADGEFVVPARIVSELGNGSTEAGARKLYAMMDRIQKARGKTVGKGKVAKNSRSEKYLPV